MLQMFLHMLRRKPCLNPFVVKRYSLPSLQSQGSQEIWQGQSRQKSLASQLTVCAPVEIYFGQGCPQAASSARLLAL